MSSESVPVSSDERPLPRKRSLRRRLLRWAVRGVAGLVVLVAVVLVSGAVWERVASGTFLDDYPPPGEMVDVGGGRRLHLRVAGEGPVTVVFESGLGGYSEEWQSLVAELEDSARVVTYDRAGYGWSDPSEDPSDAEHIVADLHAGLGGLGIGGPLVLVGHSIGGVYVRHYAATYPEEVAGLVLLDSSHEEQMERAPPAMREMMAKQIAMVRNFARLGSVGGVRLLTRLGVNPVLGEDATETERAVMSRASVYRAIGSEMGSMEASVRQSEGLRHEWGSLPMVVLTSDEIDPASEGMPPELVEIYPEMRRVWLEMQDELAGLSTRSVHEIVPGTGHYVQVDDPETVIRHIRELVGSAARE